MTNRENDLSFLQDGPDASFGWQFLGEAHSPGLRVTSQMWQGVDWKHTVWHRAGDGDTCLLCATGDLVHESDRPDFEHLASSSGMPLAMLFGIPNQPMWEMREDDLIAHSFEQYLATGELDWPLIFPMARAILRTIDALEEAFGYPRFVVTGGSKRGWAAWIAALTGDPRIVGVAPMVFDNLDFRAQMLAQIEQWGEFSPKLDDYTRRQLQVMLEEEAGHRLARLVDPLSYVEGLRCPLLLIHGTNDEFWTVDATTRYWTQLPEQKSLLAIPNVGHDLGDRVVAYRTLGEFARRCAVGERMPLVRADDSAMSVAVWSAESDDLHFHDKVWSPGDELLESSRNYAVLTRATFASAYGEYDLTTPPTILKGADRSRRR